MELSYFLPVLYAFIACLGFCGLYNLHGKLIFWVALGGALGWFTYMVVLLYSSVYVCGFVSAAVATGYSEIMARVKKCTVPTFLLIGIIPMVPGAGIFHTMEYCIQGNTSSFITEGLHTLGMAASLAIGILFADSLWRMIREFQRRYLS